MMTKRIGIGILVFGFVLAIGTAAQAVPELGVGTGTYNCASATEYFECFSGNSASGSGHAFSVTDGGEVHLWVDKDAFDGYNIWLIGDSSFSSGFTYSAGGDTYNSAALGNVGTWSSYDDPYYGVLISDYWNDATQIPAGVFPHNSANDFYILSGTISFDDSLVTPGDWLFLVAENDGLDGDGFGASGHDEFSPPTTSGIVPEPGTVLLLGSGLLGLVLYRRKVQA